MKKLFLTIVTISLLVFPICESKAQVVELPNSIDFEGYYGVNISEVSPGWVEGSGYPTPVLLSGSWFGAKVLYNSTVASVNFGKGSTRAWIVSPEFNVTENTFVFFKAAISADYNLPAEGGMGTDDEFGVYVSEDGGTSFTKVLDITNELQYNLQQFHVKLSDYKNKTIRVGFYVSDGNIQNSLSTAHLDDIKIKNLSSKDLAINGFSIANNIELNKPLKFNVEVTNEGTENLHHIPFRLDIRGPENKTEIFVVDEELKSTELKEIYLTDLTLSTPGKYSVTVTSELINDGGIENNSFTEEIVVRENKNVPLDPLDFSHSYGNVNVYDGWVEAIADPDKISFVESSWTSATYADKAGFMVPFYGTYTTDWIISPSFVVEQNTQLYFEAIMELGDGATGMGSDDKVIVYVSNDGGCTWENEGEINKDNISVNWSKYFFDLTEYEGQTVKVGLYATTGDNDDAQEFNIYIDDVSIKNFYPKDIQVDEIIEPQKPASFTNSETIAVKVTNLGSETITNFSLSYILNEAPEIKEDVSQEIPSQESYIYYFNTKADLSGLDNNISIHANLEGDHDNANNSLENISLNTYSFDLLTEGKYIQGFEDNEDFSSWVVIDGNTDGASWELHHNGDSYDYEGDYTFSYNSRNTTSPSDEWLITNGFYLEAGVDYKISFYFANRAGALPEKLRLTMGTSQTIAGQDLVLIDLGEITNNNFMKAEKSFSVPENGYYYFGFNDYGDADQYAVYIDQITVQKKFDTDLKINRLHVKKEIDYANNVLDSIRTTIIEVENKGELAVNNIPVRLEFKNESRQLTTDFEFTQTINPGEKARLVLEKEGLAFDFAKALDIKAYINSGLDEYHDNDTIQKNHYQHENFFTSFEYPDETESWITVDVDEFGLTWERVRDKSRAKSGEYYYTVKTSNTSSYPQNIDWLITDGFYFEESGCYKIKFSYRNLYAYENLKLFIGKSYDPQELTNKLFDVELNDLNLSNYLEAEVYVNVDQTGIYYLGFLTDRDVEDRYYINIDDFSVEKVNNPTPEFEIGSELIYKNAILSIENNNENVKKWQWTIDGNTFNNTTDFTYTFEDKGEYPVKLNAGNACIMNEKQSTLKIDYSLANDFTYTIDDKKVNYTVDDTDTQSLKWNFGDGNSSSISNPVNNYADYGTYHVILSLYSGFGSVNIEKDIELVESTTGIEDVFAESISLYPNPAADFVIIKVSKKGDLFIYNSTGALVKKIEIKNDQQTVDITDLNSGVYLIQINGMSSKLIVK
ncbi:MAG: choice-of-anchor J domain-containing protein [Bacteroidales bacterium]|jgi:hypothetical protein|nr:choice-of-anchor J domain-containing protein [Bacteroidales bacterium]